MVRARHPSLGEAFDHMRGEFGRTVDSSLRKTNGGFSSLMTDVKAFNKRKLATLSSSPAARSLKLPAQKVARNFSALGRVVQDLKSSSVAAVSSAVSGAVQDFNTLKANVRRNVQTLTAHGPGPIDTFSPSSLSSSSSAITSFSPSSKHVSEENPSFLAQTRVDGRPESQAAGSSSSLSGPGSEQSWSEDSPYGGPNSSVSATSVFSIGYLGPPLLGKTGECGKPSKLDDPSRPFVLEDGHREMMEPTTTSNVDVEVPFLQLEDIRISIGKALIVLNRMRSLGLPASSWENKMPWRRPRPAYLAKGLQRPQEKFASQRERHEYHRRVRRRGRYLIGPTPGWSWFAADVVFLYFLINGHSGNFLM